MAKKFKNSLDDFNMASVVSGDEATNNSKKEVVKTKKEKTVPVQLVVVSLVTPVTRMSYPNR